jgi:hypothetical protein
VDGVSIVVRSEADIEARMDAGRYSTAPPEKAVRYARQRFGADDFDRIGRDVHNATL